MTARLRRRRSPRPDRTPISSSVRADAGSVAPALRNARSTARSFPRIATTAADIHAHSVRSRQGNQCGRTRDSGFGIQDLDEGFGTWDLGLGTWGLACRFRRSGFRDWGVGIWDLTWASGFGSWELGGLGLC